VFGVSKRRGLEKGGLEIDPDRRGEDDGRLGSGGCWFGIASRREELGLGRGSSGRGAQNRTGMKENKILSSGTVLVIVSF
jgi:hypothetical protein